MATKAQDTAKPTSGKATTMAELMARHGSDIKPLQKGSVITGKVVQLTPEILLDIGQKSQALVIEYDKQKLESLLSIIKVGDEVSASVISPESEEGFPVLSLRRMLDEKVFGKLTDLYEGKKTFDITVLDMTRGGYFVTTSDGTRGFLPNSQVISENVKPGDTLSVRMIEFDRSKKRVIFSEKATRYEASTEEIKKHISTGKKVTAVITSVTPYGMYVEFEATDGMLVEGFIHISEVSTERVEGLVDKYTAGNTIEATVLDVDMTNNRVNLSLKALAAGEFEKVKEQFAVESSVKGTVEKIMQRGLVVKLDGATGFIQSTKIPSGTTFDVGQEVSAEVVGYDDRAKRILLSPVLTSKFIGYR